MPPRASQTMAAARGAKRAAAQAPKGPAAKRPKQEEDDPRVINILVAMYEAKGLDKAVRDMLIAMMPHSLGLTAPARHAHQQRVVAMFGEVLKGQLDALQDAVRNEEQNAATLSERASTAAARKTDLEGQLSAVRETLEGQRKTLAAEKEKVDAAEAVHTPAAEAKLASEKRLAELEGKQAALVKAQEHDYKVVLEGTWETGGAKQHVEPLLAVLEGEAFDSALKAALPGACTKTPEARGDFDNKVLDQLQESLTARAAELESDIASVKDGAPELAEKEASAHELISEAKAVWQEAHAAVSSSEAAEKELLKQMSEVEEIISSSTPQLRESEQQILAKRIGLDKFQSGPWKDYESLLKAGESEEAAAPAPTPPTEVTQEQAEAGA